MRRQLADDRAAPGGMPPAAAPVREAFRTQWRLILQVIGLNAAGVVGYYMFFVYVTTYLRQIDFIAASKALDINTIALLALLVMIVPIGILSDRVGRKPVLLASTGGLFMLALPLFWMLHHTETTIVLLGQIVFALLNAAYWGPSTATMVELVPNRARCTVLSVGYNLGLAILDGPDVSGEPERNGGLGLDLAGPAGHRLRHAADKGKRAGLRGDRRNEGLRRAEEMGGGEQNRERGRQTPKRRPRLPDGTARRHPGVLGEDEGSSRLHPAQVTRRFAPAPGVHGGKSLRCYAACAPGDGWQPPGSTGRVVACAPQAAQTGRTRAADPMGVPVHGNEARPPELVPVLSRGKHRSPRKGACFMELASYLAGERWSDHPACTHPLLAALARDVNDYTSDAGRARLAGLVPSVIGLTGDDLRLGARSALR